MTLKKEQEEREAEDKPPTIISNELLQEFSEPPEPRDSPRCEPLSKKFKIDFGSTSAKPPESPDSDSDDNETIDWDKDSEKDVEDDNEQCTMKKTKWLYERLAENELEEYSELGDASGAQELKEINAIRRIIDTPEFKTIRRPIESFRVMYKIIILFIIRILKIIQRSLTMKMRDFGSDHQRKLGISRIF